MHARRRFLSAAEPEGSENAMNSLASSARRWTICAAFAIALAGTGLAYAADPAPQTTPDGLELKSQSKTRLVYVKPGASLAQYDRVAILDCLVEFEKNWQKDYNSSRVGLEDRVTDKDVERMKADLAAEFKKVFAKELLPKRHRRRPTTPRRSRCADC
jgi:hypothetical protein